MVALRSQGNWRWVGLLATDQRSPSQESSRAWDSPEHLGLMEQRWLWLTHPQQTELSQLTFPEAGEVSRKETQ